jgi:chemotaxis-related protein WspB
MLLLQFCMGEARYVLPASEVVEVIPFVKLEPLPHVPPSVAGLLCYRGSSIPVVDLCQIILARPCAQRLSTRVIVVERNHHGSRYRLGMLVEKATEAKRIDDHEFVDSGITNPETPYLQGVARDEQGLLQRISTDSILADTDFEQILSHEEGG